MGDRPRALPGPRPRPRRPAGPRRPLALRHDRRRARPHRQPAPAHPPRARRLRAAVVRHGHGARRGRRRWPWPRSTTTRARAARTFALAFAHAQSGLRHLGISSEEALLFERLASRVLYADGSLRASPELLARNTLGQEGLWPHGISGDLPILLVRVVEEDDLPLVRQVLQAQEYWRLKGLSADVVILNEHPVELSRRDARRSSRALLDNGPWRTWKHRPGRRLPAARRPHGRGRAHPARGRGARGPQRRARRAGEPARPARTGPSGRSRRSSCPRGAAVAGRLGRERRACRRSRSPTAWAASRDDGRDYVSSSTASRRRRCPGPT